MMTQTAVTGHRELAETRAALYAFLAAVFGRPPSTALVEDVKDGSLLGEFASLGAEEAVGLLRAFAGRPEAVATLRDRLEVEYTGLFVLASAGKGQPFESVYRDPEQRLGGPVTVSVERAYLHAGAEPSADRLHISDHLSVELEFMAFLCRREREAWEADNRPVARRCLELEQGFLVEHLARWIALFAADVRERATMELYPAMAALAAMLIGSDRELVSGILGELAERAA